MSDLSKLNAEIGDITNRGMGFGSLSGSTFSIFHGLNALGGIPALPANADNQGLTFLTKPDLNLSYDNVIGIRKMAFLTDQNRYSMGSLIRCLLNPPETEARKTGGKEGRSLICDDLNAFLPITNLLLTLSAPPDIVADVYTSNAGIAGEQVSWIDSKPGYNGTYDLSLTFANMEGDPITTIFSTWIEYTQRVLEGSMLPFPSNIVENRVDYQTRIYRLVLDRTRTFVQRIYACGAAFPTSVPTGAPHGYTHGVHLSPESDQIQINFKCMGAIFDDPILVVEFNKQVALWNPDMESRNTMVKVTGLTESGMNKQAILNYRLYPFISKTMELEWYASAVDYAKLTTTANAISVIPQVNSKPSMPVISPWTNTLENNTLTSGTPTMSIKS